jgi:pimeloyl-ACP methyl ester carboxylesterase
VDATARSSGGGASGDDARPYTWRTDPLGGVPSVTYLPLGAARGTVVMLHGGPHAATWPLFSPLIAFLTEQGWRVVTPNVSSSALASLGLPAGALGTDDAADVVHVANAARDEGGAPVAVVGWSYGAYVGARAIALGLRCAGLVALSGVLDPTAVEARHPALARFLAAHALPPTPPAALGDVPVLAVHGRHDGRVDVTAHRRYVESLPAGTYLELPDEGHLILTDGGASLAYPALADWLARR